MPWNPTQYLGFAHERLRPALDLLARVPVEAPTTVLDLGCGAGNVTRLLAERWPQARVTGIDNSAAMLARARQEAPDIGWEEADLAHWRPTAHVDVLYSNAALHWLDDHATLFPRLAAAVNPGGVLAIQMPNNFAAPSHTCCFAAAQAGPWRDTLAPLLRPAPLLSPGDYYTLLAPTARRVDIWETRYQHALKGDNPVADWTRGSLLVPLLEALPPDEAAAFEADYRSRIARAYPRLPDGTTLLPFSRLFIVAQY